MFFERNDEAGSVGDLVEPKNRRTEESRIFSPPLPSSLFPLPSRSPSLPLSLSLLLFLAACAVPQPPTGGPTDTTPPLLASSTPAAEAVNVSTQAITLTFNEYIDQASFARALSITPEPEGRLDIAWRRRTVTITLPEALEPNTTYILSLDNTLRDVHGVALKQPITLAFATGAVINRGRLDGRVVQALEGSGVADVDVYAYAATQPLDSLPERPTYRTQTNEQGQFTFSFLREQPYVVLALEDRNRNRRPDPGEAFAVPPQATLTADTTTTETPPWILYQRDTTPPDVQRVRPLSDQRLALRFSEPVQFVQRDPDAWLLADSATGNAATLRALYQPPEERREVWLYTDPLPPTPHRLVPAALADSSGNAVAPDTLFFTPPQAPDTLRTRFVGFVPDSNAAVITLPPGLTPGVRFNQPLADSLLRAALSVRDTTGQALAFTTETPDGTTYRIRPDPPLTSAQIIELAIDNATLGLADTVFVQRFQRLADTSLGSLSGVILPPDTTAGETLPPIIVELFEGDIWITRTAARPDGTFVFEQLPQGTYRFRAFLDRDRNEQWSAGSLIPYLPPEPLVWSDAATWRARWDAALADTLRLPIHLP